MLRLEDGGKTNSLESTNLEDEGYLEEDLRKWIINSPEGILGEDILLVGREVAVKEIGDAIDLLGIDPDGNLIIIELKRGLLRDHVDFQGLKYAAYAANWDYDDLKEQFNNFKVSKWGTDLYDQSVSFTEKLDEFCNDEYGLNQDQRILLIGESVKERINLVVRWLSDRSIEVAVIEVRLLKEDGRLYIDAEQTIPTPESTPPKVRPDTSDKPWKVDGRDWHLNERLNSETAALLDEIVEAIDEIEELEGPRWGQKLYVAFRQARKNRVILRTYQELFHIRIFDVNPENVEVERVANVIGKNPDDVTAENQVGGTQRPGIQITCYGGDSINYDALTEEIRSLI